MVISETRKYIFFEIPRTASRAMNLWLLEHLDGTLLPRSRHKTDFFRRHSKVDVSEHFKFAVVRHPLDRLVSIFHFAFYGRVFREGYSFADFLREYDKKTMAEYMLRMGELKWVKRWGQKWHGYTRQKDFVLSLDLSLDRMLRYENLRDELIALPFVRKGEIDSFQVVGPSTLRKPIEFYYGDPDILKLALKICRDDMVFLGYQVKDILGNG